MFSRVSVFSFCALRANSTFTAPALFTSLSDITANNIGSFFKVPNADSKSLAFRSGIRQDLKDIFVALNETCLIIRRPVVDVAKYLSSVKSKTSAVRFVLYGGHGTGKRTSLFLVQHYARASGWVICDLSWGGHLLYHHQKDVLPSPSLDGYLDLSLPSQWWLERFRSVNEHLLDKLKTENEYNWTAREIHPKGTSFRTVVEFGLEREKFRCSVVGLIMKELMAMSSSHGPRVLFTICGVNALWLPTTIEVEGSEDRVHSSRLSLVYYLRDMLKCNWSGGAVVTSVDASARREKDPSVPFEPIMPKIGYGDETPYLPYSLLDRDGFEHMDPFIPIEVTRYSDDETFSWFRYHVAKKWIQKPEAHNLETFKELSMLSYNYPLHLYRSCRYL